MYKYDVESLNSDNAGIASPGLGDPTIQIISSRPNIRDFVEYLDATVIARGRVTVPTQKVNFLVKLDPSDKPTWWKRLWEDPLKIVPTVQVTIELVRVSVSLFPLPNYENHVLLKHGLEEYVMRVHSKTPCSGDFATALGGGFRITAQKSIEDDLGIAGQLDALLKQSKIALPMSAQDQQRHFWIVYATFPTKIRKYIIPKTRILLDEFKFDQSSLTPTHIGKILAIVRYAEAMRLSSSTGAGFKVGLVGHTDDRGTEKYNVALGDRRASEVKEALSKALDGIRPGLTSQFTLLTKSFGETKPLVKAKTEAEHARNRRVEVLLPIPKSFCRRVSLRAVVKRALDLLPRLGSPEQANRIRCLLRKVAQQGTDDRWAPPELILNVYNTGKPLGTYPFSLLRDQLTIAGVVGNSVPDAQILRLLESIDQSIITGIGEVNKRIHLLSQAASQGIPLINKMKAMDALRAWMHERVQNDQSIYSCYRNV